MAKLALILSTFALLLLLANASIYRTTVEIDDEAENPRGQSCDEQIQQQQRLRHCQLFMRSQQQGGGGRGRWELVNQRQPPHLSECCSQLRQLETRCRCRGLEQAVRGQQGQGQGQYGSEEVMQIASDIPRMCDVSPRQGCQFGSPYTF